MQKIDGCVVTTAKSTEEIINNIKVNSRNDYSEINKSIHWRDQLPIAIVGGGPSIKDHISELSDYRFVYACGSVHDYLINNNAKITHTVICDPDEIMLAYLQRLKENITYFIASQSHPKVFEHFKEYSKYIWHAGGENLDNNVFGENKVIIGGGCTVGTRAICLAIGMGFNNIHLYGFDTCLDEKFNHHAYEFIDKEKESIGNIHEISLDGPDGRKFYVAGYMLGQLFDFQTLLKIYGNRVQFTVHGDGLLKHLMDLAEKKRLELQNGH